MSEQETKTPLETLNIARNNTTVAFISAEKKRGDSAGELYYAIDPSTSLEDVIGYLDKDVAKNMLIARINIVAQRLMSEACTNEAGEPKPLDIDELKKSLVEFSARGLTSQELVDEITRVTNELVAMSLDPEFIALDKEERLAKAKVKAERIKELQAAVAKRKRKKEDESTAS
jgi:hypothetical protein